MLRFEGFPNPWDIILNKRRFEYAMVGSVTLISYLDY